VPINGLLDELKAQYDKEFETQEALDEKTSNMMATAGTVTSLLFGFGTFLVARIEPTYALLYFAILSLLLAAIITNIFSVFMCVKAYYVRDYYFVAKDKSFLKKNPNSYTAKDDIAGLKGLDDDRIRHYIEMEESDFKLSLIRTYIRYNLINADNNDKKAKYVTLAQLTFLIGLVIIPILLAIVLHASSVGAINISID
jgi:hypothetical protein